MIAAKFQKDVRVEVPGAKADGNYLCDTSELKRRQKQREKEAKKAEKVKSWSYTTGLLLHDC